MGKHGPILEFTGVSLENINLILRLTLVSFLILQFDSRHLVFHTISQTITSLGKLGL